MQLTQKNAKEGITEFEFKAVDPKLLIRTDGSLLEVELCIPPEPVGVAILADGTNPNAFEKFRNIATHLQSLGFATAIVDLLTRPEEQMAKRGHAVRSNQYLLAARLKHVLSELSSQKAVGGLPTILVCSGVAAASAILVAAHTHGGPRALVLIDGRIDIAKRNLGSLFTPILLVLKKSDELLVDINTDIMNRVNHADKAMIEVGDSDKDWDDAVQEIGAWLCQFAEGPEDETDARGAS